MTGTCEPSRFSHASSASRVTMSPALTQALTVLVILGVARVGGQNPGLPLSTVKTFGPSHSADN